MRIIETPGREQPFAVWDNKMMTVYRFERTREEAEHYLKTRTGARKALVQRDEEAVDAMNDYLRRHGR